MDYETATVGQIAEHFKTISRQRIQQILKKYQDRDDSGTVKKICAAKRELKKYKQIVKSGYTAEDHRKCHSIWTFMVKRIGKVPAYKDCTNGFTSEAQFRLWALKQIGFRETGFDLDKDILVKGNRVYSPDTCVFVPYEVNLLLSGCYKAKKRGKYPIGVSFDKTIKRFKAQMSSRQERGLNKYLGCFPTAEAAFACYKAAKEARMQMLANKWKDHIDPRAYEALMKRTVEWDD